MSKYRSKYDRNSYVSKYNSTEGDSNDESESPRRVDGDRDRASKDSDYEHDKRDNYGDDDGGDEEDETEEFPIGNLLKYFSNNNIQIRGIFSYEERVTIIFIYFLNSGISLFIYVPSKYYIKIDSSVKNYMHISMKSEDEPSIDRSLFINSKMKSNRRMFETSFHRIKPLLEDSNYKLTHVDKEMLIYLDRHNEEVNTFSFNTPFNKKGFYFMIDLENFYKSAGNTEREIQSMEMLLNTKMYKVYDTELSDLKKTLIEIATNVKEFSSSKEITTYNDRIKRVNEVMIKNKNLGKSVTDCLEVAEKIREKNLSTLFYYEKIITFLNEIKELNE